MNFQFLNFQTPQNGVLNKKLMLFMLIRALASSLIFIFGVIFAPRVFAQEKKIAVANNFGQIMFYNLDGQFLSSFNLPENIQGRVNLEIGDVDGDFKNEIVVMPKQDDSKIRIFMENKELKYLILGNKSFSDFSLTKEREPKSLSNSPFIKGREPKFLFNSPYGEIDSLFNFPLCKRGIKGDFCKEKGLTLGDLNDDGKLEIIVSTTPYIKIFNYKGKLLDKFIPFSKNYRAEIKIASGDIDRDRKDEIIFSSSGLSKIFIYKNKKIYPVSIDISNYNDFSISVGDLEGDGKSEFGICSFLRNNRCKISKFNHQNIIWPNNLISNNEIYLKLEDVDDDGRVEAVVGEKYGGRINIYKINHKVSIWKTIYTLQDISDIDVFSLKTKIRAKVIYVDDGDTIFLDSGQEIRYIGIDTPEIGEPFYLEATNKNKELVYRKKVTIEYDKQKIDPFGRYLAYVFSDGVFINEELVKQGLAKLEFIYPDVKYAKRLIRAQNR